uniref:hypothetical protein n=1 Tax=Candidatus Magnetominusculus dajiuhuensis TaxID=3137712 RepID=UPI003B433C2D
MGNDGNKSEEGRVKGLLVFFYDEIKKYYLKLIISLIALSFVFIFMFTSKSSDKSFIDRAIEIWTGGYYILIAFVACIFSYVYQFMTDVKISIGKLEGRFDAHANTIDGKVKQQLSESLNKARIVIQMSVEPLNTIHVEKIRDILNLLEENEQVNRIYAIDNTSPNLWWTNSMLGYLACQAKWFSRKKDNKKDNVKDNEVHRFFVMCEGEMQKVEGKKIIQIHHLMGFETYIILKEFYNELIYKYYKDLTDTGIYDLGEQIYNRELLIWNDSIANSVNLDHDCIYGYHSYWDIDLTQEDRNSMIKGIDVCDEDEPFKDDSLRIELLKEHPYETDCKGKSNKIVSHYMSILNILMDCRKRCENIEHVAHKVKDTSDVVHIPADTPIKIGTISDIIPKLRYRNLHLLIKGFLK